MNGEKVGRLRWRCRRGMKELDLILEHYLENFPQSPPAEQEAFAHLLELSDLELVAWLIYGQPCPDPELKNIVASLRRCAPSNLSSNARE